MQSAGGSGESGDEAVCDIMRRLGVSGQAIAETASRIYLAVKSIPGYSHQEMRAASVYASCRLFGVPRTLKEVASVCGVDVTPLASRYRMVVERAGLTMPIPDPAAYLSGVASRAGLDAPTERRATEIVNLAKRLGATAGRDPTAVAAAALYMAYVELCPEESFFDPETRITQVEIARAAGVSEITLRNRTKTIRGAIAKEPAGHHS